MNEDLQKNPNNNSDSLLSPFIRAQARSKIIDSKLKTFDNRFALFRLLSTIALLAIVVNYAQKSNSTTTLLLIILFLIFCLFTSWIHNIIQAKQKKWNAVALSYELSEARSQRDFDFITTQKSPWHDECIVVPKGHVYSSDLDIHTQLYLLLNTCSTKEGSQKLFSMLMEAGIQPEQTQIVIERSKNAQTLSRKTRLLRHFESLRLSESFLQKYFKLYEKKVEGENSELEEKKDSNSIVSISFRIFYAFVSICAWFIILIPAFNNFISTGNTEAFLQPIFLYTGFLLLGTLIFTPITQLATKVAQSSKTLQEIINTLNNNESIAESLQFTFLKKQAKAKIKSLNLLLDLVSLRGNPIFWVTLHIFLPFDALVCLILQLKIKNFSATLKVWENELYEFDVIASFARFASENPNSRFVTLSERKQASDQQIECTHLGHPLIATQKRICNTIKLHKSSPVVLLTGSNMAGKSTFLRTLGTNIVLANIGAPVFATKFIMPPFRLLCAIRIDDSLSEGTSYFYAEVKRLHFILNSLNNSYQNPGFFLIDEIFRGTNNKERYIGSWHIIHALFEKNSFGFISTHDLALTELDKNDSRLINMHFREHIEGLKLAFDYLIKEGPCPTTNALYIMKQHGLPVP
ncbi:MutS-related protein [Fluviispira multicolorata]|uniref:DNA mismatch repair proteins mutS family domain-containing protein n=1 Tax=Fluviispira multicolorata TaxID=2654512 RepID=A0A833N877_9BACT|nr:hypothetical protein [Fluviispira multicolorata]KAB8033701.1 hypothetical protein GCL57_03065 [Fluviispira multicolorata]